MMDLKTVQQLLIIMAVDQTDMILRDMIDMDLIEQEFIKLLECLMMKECLLEPLMVNG